MKLFQRIGAALSVLRSGSPATNVWLTGSESKSSGNLSNALEQSAWVYSCVSFLARSVASLPYRISKGKEILDSGPVVELFAQPHEYITSNDLWEHAVYWMLLRGRCFVAGLDRNGNYLRIIGPGARLPDRLVIVPADRVTPVHAPQHLQGWRYFAGHCDLTPSHDFLPEELLFIATPNPFDFWGGLAPLTVAALAASTDRAAALFQRGLAESNGELGFLVTSEHQLTDPQINQVKAALAERRRGAGVAARPLFLPNGSKVERPAVTSADAQFMENRKFSRQEVCAVFGVSESLLGFVEDVNRSSGDAQHDGFVFNTLAPLARRLDGAFGAIARTMGLTAAHDVGGHPIMQSARRQRLDTAVKAVSIGVPFNAANRVLDLGFEDQPWGNTWWKPFGLESVSPQAEIVQPVASSKAADPFGQLADLIGPALICRSSDDFFSKSIRAAVSLARGKIQRIFFAQRSRVLAKLAAKNKSGSKALQRGLPEEIWDKTLEDKLLTESLNKLLADDFKFGAAQVAEELSLVDLALKPEATLDFLASRKNELSNVNDTTFDGIKSQLAEGLDKGESFEQLAERVKSVFNDATHRRAETIAQTEVGIATNSGRFAGMKAAGVEYKMWLDSNLEGTRPAHQQAGTEYDRAGAIPFLNAFLVGGEDMDHPGDPKGSPGNVINCRCTILAVSKDEKSEFKCVRPSSFLDYRTFADRPKELSNP